MSPDSIPSGDGLNPEITRRVIIFVAVVGVGLYLGLHVASQPLMSVAAVTGFCLLFLLFARPSLFFLLTLFFLFGAFNLVDVDQVARIPGLFRAKDLLLGLAAGYAIASVCLRNLPPFPLRSSRLFKPMVVFLVFLAFQMWRTKVFLHEAPILLFRQGRHYLTYGLPLVLFFLFRTERNWRSLDRFCLFFIFLTTALNAVEGVVGPLPFYQNVANAAEFGVFKSYNPAVLLTYWFFFRRFWMYCEKPSGQNVLWLLAVSLAVVFYFHRGMVAGAMIAMAVTLVLVPPKVRVRAAAMLLVVALLLLSLTVITVAVSQTAPASDVAATMKNYFVSTVTDLVRVEGTYRSRVLIDTQRYPLVRQHPFVGIGFLSVFGEVAYTMWKTGGVLPVGTVDTGWLDLMLRLGGIGTGLLLLLLGQAVRVNSALLPAKGWSNSEHGLILANICVLVLAVVSSIAGGALVWEPGITTIALIFAWTMRLEHAATERVAAPQPGQAAMLPAQRGGFQPPPGRQLPLPTPG
ncbi:MAG: hypothetical protein V1873_07485 [Verrucomicrobiota bacterium]